VGGIPKDDRFKYQRREQILQELSPGPTTATPADSIILPRITSIGKLYFLIKFQLKLMDRCGKMGPKEDPEIDLKIIRKFFILRQLKIFREKLLPATFIKRTSTKH
jgi:hypothetical protein